MTRIACLILATLPLFAADSITLRNGNRQYGTFIGSSGRVVTFEVENGARQQYNTSEVQSIEFDTSNRAGFGDRSRTDSDRAVSPTGRAIPVGTELTVRTNEAIQSDSATPGRIYTAIAEKDVVDSSGQVVIPRGSAAQLVVRDISKSGALGGQEVALDLQSVTVGGQTYLVSAEDVRTGNQGVGANRRTAEMVGGGAVLGTLLGAVAGGGKGAAIGAIAGAAAGAGVQVLTRGKTVNVPAETVLTFRLDQPLTLQPMKR